MVGHVPLGFDSKLWEGRKAIFREKWIISHVRVHTIRTNERCLLAKLDVIPIRGLYGEERPAISIGGIWDYLFIDEHIWLGTCTPHMEIREVLATMAEHQIRRLPVVDQDNRVRGIVGLSDLLRHNAGDSRDIWMALSRITAPKEVTAKAA